MTINTDSTSQQSGRRAEESNSIQKDAKRSIEVTFPVSAVEVIYHAAWALVLARHGNIEEVVYGHTAKSLGKNPVPVRLAVEPETESGAFLRRVKECLCNLSIGEVGSLGGASTCTFDSVLSLSPNHDDSSDNKYGQFLQPLVLSGKIFNQSTIIRVWFDEEAFSYSEVSILLSHFEEAVMQFTQLPSSINLQDISIFSKLDQKKIFSWNRHAPKAVDKTFTALFEEQARLRPSATAVCSWDKTLTYAELDDMSRKLSGKLIEMFGPLRQTIPLLFEKSALAIVSMLAVLRAGGSFVHLGISNPTGRMRAIADACKATTILCGATYRSAVQPLSRNILVVDDKLVERLQLPSSPLPLIQPTDVALIQFTSGSTGIPKGIVLEHGSLATTCEVMGAKTNIGPQSRILQFSAYTFDASFGDIFFSLARGACVCSPSEQERLDSLAVTARRLMVTWVFLTPSVLSLLQPQDIPSLRTVLVGGEKVPQRLVTHWAENVSLHIMMGPSECSVYCASTEPVRPNQDPSNFGHAVGCRAWVVEPSDYSKLAPLDCVGELILEGRIVGREYLNDPQRTMASFLYEMPWLPVPHEKGDARLYKSGDIVRMNSRDGTLSFVGRKDQQFKLHGQRIEVGEIEHNIKKALSDVKRVLALMRSAEQGSSRHSLVAFLIIERGSPMVCNTNTVVQSFTEYGYNMLRAMRGAVAEALPSYMIPTLFVPLYEAPLNASGKTDATQLRRLIDNLSQKQLLDFALSQTTTTATLTLAEANLRSLWAKILHMDKSLIGPDSEFLRLGGDSLAAMTLVLEAAKTGIHLTLPDVLKASRLSTMASSIRNFPEQIQETEIGPYTLLPTGTRLASLKAHCASTCRVNPSQIEDIFPSTPVQEMLFASSLKHPGSYITRLSCRLPSTVSLSAWKSAWDEVLKTVDIFRARIVFNSNSDLLQVVISGAIDWIFHDNLEGYWARDTQITMNSGDPLVRFGIIQDGPSEQPIFALTCHHMIYDAFTLNMVFEQVTNACKSQPVESLASFKNYVSYIKSLPLEPSREFWRHKLEGSSTASWPPNPALEIHPTFTQGYASIPTLQTADFTVAMYAQTAYALLISAYSGSQDTVFGLIDSGRQALLRSIMNIAGPTLQTVPFRSIINPNEKLGQLMSRFRADTFEMADHGHIGLQQIRQISPYSAQACDFRTLLVIQPQELTKHSNGFDIDPSITESVATYALVFECRLVEGGIDIVAEYDSRTLSKIEVDRFIRQFAHLVSKLATSSLDLPLSDIGLVSDEDLEQIQRWNSRKDVEVQDSIHDVIGLRMAEYASLQAVCGWDGTLTYGELDSISARLAVRLRALGVTSESIVPICSEKSGWVPVAVVAILRAGGAFLLLDPSNPGDRLRDMVSQVEAKQIIVSPNFVDLWTPSVPDLIVLSPAIRQWEEQQESDSWPRSGPHNLAYVVFTSGSTGKPKGVLVEHTNFLTPALARAPGIYRTHGSRVYQFASYYFDTSVEDMLTTLIVGGTICIPNEQEHKSNLIASMNKYTANTVDLTPSVANLITPSMVPLLKVLILGGEAMTESHLERWASSDCKLINTYGPAECSIVGTVAEPARAGFSANDIVIGKAPCGHAWVVDPLDHRKLAPIGAIGELLIEGPLVARGYLNDPLKTDEKFVKNLPWVSSPARFYKTGDLVKYQDNGNLAFIGRRDSQVKIYGQRLELGEIERRLLTAKHILSAAVELFKFSNSRQRLVAFVCFGQDENSTCKILEMSPQLRGQLAVVEASLIEALPRYMVPTAFIPLNTMPLAVTGKLDRRFMRQMVNNMSQDTLLQYTLSESAGDRKAPNTKAQHRLQKIWSEVLDISQNKIGLNSNFFGIGGDSISAMQLSMSISQQHGSNLSVADVLRNPILADMADLLMLSSNAMAEPFLSDPGPFTLLKAELSVADVLQQSGLEWSEDEIEDIYPCTPLQEGFMALGASQPEAYVARQVFRIPDHLDIERFRNCWTQVMTTHAILRTRIVYLENHGSLQVVGKNICDWVFVNSLENYITQDRSIGMSYNDSLCRFCIVQEEVPKQRYLVHTMHHALFDGVSLQTLDRQVSLLYRSYAAQIPQVPFTRFISYLQSIDPAANENFWRNQLQGAPSTSFLARKTNGDRRQDKIATSISFNRNPSGVLSMCTPASAVRAAWALLVSTYSESSDVLFGSTLSGRNVPVPEIMEMAAPTLTTVPIRVTIDMDQTLFEYAKKIQQQAIDMIPYEHYGLQNIRPIQPQATNFNHILILHGENFSNGDDSMVEAVDINQLGLGSSSSTKGYYTHSLVMDCTFYKDTLKLEVFYDANVVNNQQMQRIVHSFEHILNQVTTNNVNLALRDIVLCSPQDHQEILEWNAVENREMPHLIHQLVKDTSTLHANLPAVDGWDGNLTYGKLELLSSKLASFLIQRLDFHEDIVIPICFDKSIFTVVSMLAVLKMGAAYVPMEPSYPASRLQEIVEQVDARIVLISAKYHSTFSEKVDHVIIVDNSLLESISQALDEKLRHEHLSTPTPASRAMIIFTSGSTGKPKGVVLTHGAFSTMALALGPELRLGIHTRALQFAAYAFDVSNAEIFLTLIHGGCVCIPSHHDRMNNLAEVIVRMRINWLYLTPTGSSLLKGPNEVPCVKTLLLGGEAARKDIIDTWVSNVHLVNTYGPAEGTIWPSITTFTPESSPLYIGRGNNCYMWLVDPENHHRLMPIGAVGEIILEGPLLAAGYFNDPEKTQQAFVHDLHWASNKGKPRRFYATGDLATYNTDGTMSFAGRIGTMVKLRGQRLELGEVEARIKRFLPNDARVCVELMSMQSHSDRLVAFVTTPDGDRLPNQDWLVPPSSGTRATFSILHSSLTTVLPSYMIPSLYVPLNTMPTTFSGKTDRKLLRTWYSNSPNSELENYLLWNDGKKAPRTINESHIQGLWSRVLNKDRSIIGVDDNFFTVGGDSLKAIKLASMARSAGIALNVADIFLNPKLVNQAAKADTSVLQIQESSRSYSLMDQGDESRNNLLAEAAAWGLSMVKDVYPCTPLQEGLMSMSVQQRGAYIMNHAFKLPSDLDIPRFQEAWTSAVATFDVLRTRIIPHATLNFLQIILQEDPPKWQLLDSLNSVLADPKPASPYFGEGLVRYYLFNESTKSDQKLFILRIHHALFDAKSLQNIVDYVEKLYFDLPLPSVLPYGLFVQYTKESKSSSSQAYWSKTLGNFEGCVFPEGEAKLATSRSAASFSTSVTFEWDRSARYTMATSLVGSWALLLSSYTGSSDVLFGLTLSGRDAPVFGVESMTGPTLTTIPRRIRVRSVGKVEDFLAELQRDGAEVIEHQHYGLQNIMSIPELHSACKFNNRLILETAPLGHESRLMKDYPLHLPGNYFTDPLGIICVLEPSETSTVRLHIQAMFDESLISQMEVKSLMSQLGHVVQQLSQPRKDLETVTVCEDATKLELLSSSSQEVLREFLQANLSDLATVVSGAPKIYSYHGAAVWAGDITNPERLAPLGAIGELCVENSLLVPVNGSDHSQSSSSIGSPRRQDELQSVPAYRTGHLVRYKSDYSLTYIGRKEDQVFVRGQRINLQEIEQHAREAFDMEILLAAEVITSLNTSTPVLAVFFQTGDAENSESVIEDDKKLLQQQFCSKIGRLREILQSSLPSFKLPLAFIPLKSMPTTAAGEIDRERVRQLQATLNLKSINELLEYQNLKDIPSTDMEKILQSLWSQILGLDALKIRKNSSWIRLGGDSMSAVRLVALSHTKGVEIRVSNILSSTLSELAKLASLTQEFPQNASELKNERLQRVQKAYEDEHLASAIQSQLQLSRSDVEDVASATNFQTSMVVGGMLPERGWNNYLIFDSDEVSGCQRLVETWQTMVTYNPSLRTLFLIYGGKILQIVAGSVTVEIEDIKSQDVEAACKNWILEDMKKPPTLDQPILRGVLISGGLNRARFVIGISHALYDGMSLIQLRNDFLAAYHGKPLASRPTFASYVKNVSRNRSQGILFWKNILAGSKMTEIVHHPMPLYKHPLTETLSYTIAMPDVAARGYTFTTLFKAAWTIVLRHWTNTTDITFGHLVSGRSASYLNVDEVVGPCLNIMPVRMNLKSPYIIDLLQQIHSQHIEAIPFEAVGFSDIVAECTNWPKWTRFSSIIQHQNIDNIDPSTSPEWGNTKMTAFSPYLDYTDVWVITYPEGPNVRVDMDFSPEVIPPHIASKLLHHLCGLLDFLSTHTDEPLPEPPAEFQQLPNLPLHYETDAHETFSSGIESQEHLAVVDDIWNSFGLDKADIDTPFYDLSGDLVPALQISSAFMARFGVQVEVNKIVANATKRQQAQMIQGFLDIGKE